MYIYIAVFVFLVFVLWKERQALGCPEGLTFADCDNANGKAIKGTQPYPTDSTPVVADKIKKAADFGDRWVMWRIGLLLSVPCVIITYFFLNAPVFTTGKSSMFCYEGAKGMMCDIARSFPSEKELVVGMFVITTLVYFTLNFYKFHLINYAKKNIEEGVDILQNRIK